MCRRMPLLLMMGLVVMGVMMIHHIRRSRPVVTASRIEDVDPGPDAAATLREMTHAATPEKSWVREGGDQSDADAKLIVGRTRKPAVNEKEALHEARQDVEGRVLAAVDDAIHPSPLDEKVLRRRVASDVAAGRFEIDRVGETFERPYGQVWTETVLVDLSPNKLNPIIAEYRHELQNNRNRVRAHWVGLVAITVMVLFGYTLSDAITRGYFTGRLRMMALLIVALGAAALI